MTRIANSFINLPCFSSFWPACLTVSMVSIQVNRNMLKHNRSDAKNVHFKVMIRYPSRRLLVIPTRFTLLLMVPKPSSPLARARAHSQGGALLRALTDRDLLGFRRRRQRWENLPCDCFVVELEALDHHQFSLSSSRRKEEHREVGWSLFTPFKWFLFLWEKQKKMAY